jgi:ferredoxin-NADP reductase/mono/diheme cytochrome c family protein
MSGTSASLTFGILFVAIGAANVWLILQASAKVKNARASARLVAAHRIGGYIFILLFCVMGYFMLARMRDTGGNVSAGTLIHMTLAMLLSPLLFVKVLIARYYKTYYNYLLPIGLLIFVLSFVLVAITAGPYLIRKATLRSVSLEEINLTNATIDVTQAAATMQDRCSKCHNLDRVVGARKDARGWLATVNRMREMPASGISEEDVKTIVLFLGSQHPPAQSEPEASMTVARALVTQRCAGCHSLDRIYKAAKTPAEWRDTVALMISYAQTDGTAGVFQPGEDQQIVDFLAATQTPEAVERRKTLASAASSAGQSVVIPKVTAPKQAAPGSDRSIIKTAGFILAGCVGVTAMIIRRPGKAGKLPAGALAPASIVGNEAEPVAPSASNKAMVLQLVRVTRQTADAKTLRFALTGNSRVMARPGQFLTFTFLFDGKKTVRSYSICSSPAVSGYIEITPKRVENGCASVFLNDRAVPGMTVEASGPFGNFCFDEAKQRRIVLIAGGSGITPMMAMLRYIDDLCLNTRVTLLYSVRTEGDIIFHRELAELKGRLENFEYQLVVSQPSSEWRGPKGRLSHDLMKAAVTEPGASDFFLCGPGPFMEAARQILTALKVAPERIYQESFGSAPPTDGQPKAAAAGVVTTTAEFVRSGKSCPVRPGQTLLQAAEEHGVEIRSACRQGQCGTCKTKLLAGKVTMEAEQGLPPEAKAQGFVLTCVGHAHGPVKLDA